MKISALLVISGLFGGLLARASYSSSQRHGGGQPYSASFNQGQQNYYDPNQGQGFSDPYNQGQQSYGPYQGQGSSDPYNQGQQSYGPYQGQGSSDPYNQGQQGYDPYQGQGSSAAFGQGQQGYAPNQGQGYSPQYGQGQQQNFFNPSHYGGHGCYGISKKKVSYDYQNKFSYGQGNRHGYYGRRCRSSSHYSGSSGHQYCPNDGYGWGYGNRHRQCDQTYCQVHALYGYSRCHGKVRLSHGYGYYGQECKVYGRPCGGYGFNPYGHGNSYGGSGRHFGGLGGSFGGGSGQYGGGWGGGHGYNRCHCKTYYCSTPVKACYHHQGYYYEDTVHIRAPCGCYCRRSYGSHGRY